eukprot:comp22363_c0_seq2/m.33324 comp22363_c0_seq2/g.33324  ORF comp22363_c0_seq2/g.33324 comp22363_c0_seq2/m.33324 type:complete len:405 (-) comp22363_c0_seq2:239-1453(-)
MVKKTVQVLLAALAGVQATPLHLKTSVEDGVSSLLLEASSEFVKAATHVVKGMGSVSMATDLLVTRQAVDAIHSAQNYWTAVDPEDVDNVFHNWTVSRFRSILNRAHDVPKATNANDGPERLVEFFNQPNHKLPIRKIRGNFTALPKSFDSREKWYDCQSVHMIRDQGECGACWAFGTTSAMSDRTCIHSNGKIQDILAARDLMSCCPYCANDGGCNGGWPEDAYTYWHEYGLVTGDNHGSMLGCQPYPIPISLYHGKNNSAVKDTNGRYINSPECVRKCTNEIYTRRNFTTDKIKAKEVYRLEPLDTFGAMWEIFTNGPITVGYNVYKDFPLYKDGVYVKTTSDCLAPHIVSIIGWGEENNVPYWVVRNSWNRLWGHHGFFKMRRGTNECGIEEVMIAGIPDV